MLVRVPGAPHHIAARPTHLMAKVGNILAWFERYDGDGDFDSGEAPDSADTMDSSLSAAGD